MGGTSPKADTFGGLRWHLASELILVMPM